MSSTSLSFIDDGCFFTRRIPPATPLANVTHWLHTTQLNPDTASVYTGSYIDDGLDLFPSKSNTPGFGHVDPRFYKHKKRRGKGDEVWNEDIARAVSGDIQRSLAKMRDVAGVEVKRSATDSKEEKRRSEKERGVVSVPAPLDWGTFVIKGDGGRVVVVDKRGEFDSGALRRGDEVTRESKRWIRAARSPSPPAFDRPPPGNSAVAETARLARANEKRSKSRRESKTKTKISRTSKERCKPRALSPVLELTYDSDEPVKPSAVSPTDFFMTGGLSGWSSPIQPSRAPSLVPPSPIVPHAITCDTSTSPYTYDSSSKPDSKPKSGYHSVHTLPDGWPSQPASPTRSVCSSTFTYLQPTSRKRSSRRSSRARSEQSSRHGHDDQEVVSNYQAPNIIEVTYDETPPGEMSYPQAGWNDEALSALGWSAADDEERNKSSDLGWGSSAKASVWAGDEVQSKPGGVREWSNDETRPQDENDKWDGFERPKTTSEVSVAGGSERSWPASQHSAHTVQTLYSYHNHTSRRSSRHSPTDWPASRAASQAGSAVQSEHGWRASAHGSEHSKQSWSRSRRDSDTNSPTKYRNGFDEDNAAYLNETWGGIPARVASPHKSVAGWD
ncbi:hypothetical protein E8E12_009852 [Didymella heteroderae]|uniref:Uncharacterized protein n=1 Tax=Didymella heteroderae TaxID=1769908 RepID=A0A9P4WYW0_9PLEO|nr:hypothetical protein E8E12_009852 [Didymella heteroderae]